MENEHFRQSITLVFDIPAERDPGTNPGKYKSVKKLYNDLMEDLDNLISDKYKDRLERLGIDFDFGDDILDW